MFIDLSVSSSRSVRSDMYMALLAERVILSF